MKRFLKNLGLFLIVQLIAWLAIVSVYLHCRPIGQHYLAESIDKQQLLQHQSSPRIVFLGGSNLAFGLNSAAFAAETAFKPVNMGLHVELGLDFMLKEARSGLRRGDVVVLSPEYELFGAGYSGGGEILYTALEQNPSNFRYFSWRNVRRVTDYAYSLASQILDYDWKCLAKDKLAYDPSDPNNVYRRTAFNEFGDDVAHWGKDSREFPLPRLDDKVSRLTINRTISAVRDFQIWSEQNGITVVFSFPVVPQEYLQQNRDSVFQIKSAVASLTCPVIDSPDEMSWPMDAFFDTPYHLTEVATKRRTAQILSRLREKGFVK